MARIDVHDGSAHVAFGLVVCAALLLSACGAAPADDDSSRIVASVLKQLTAATPQAICVDGRTEGEPLAIFRTMIVAPDPSRRALVWRAPGSLLPNRVVADKALGEGNLSDSRTRIPLADPATAALPMVDQVRLNEVAREAMIAVAAPQGPISDSMEAPLARVRWWPLNRIGGGCREIYVVSRPVIIRGMAFVSVTAGHQGTTYALENRQQSWVPVAQWANWIY